MPFMDNVAVFIINITRSSGIAAHKISCKDAGRLLFGQQCVMVWTFEVGGEGVILKI